MPVLRPAQALKGVAVPLKTLLGHSVSKVAEATPPPKRSSAVSSPDHLGQPQCPRTHLVPASQTPLEQGPGLVCLTVWGTQDRHPCGGHSRGPQAGISPLPDPCMASLASSVPNYGP